MTVRIKLVGLMAKFYKTSPRAKIESVELPDNATVADLIDLYGIPRKKVHLIMVNKIRRDFNEALHDGDEVWALPLAIGG